MSMAELASAAPTSGGVSLDYAKFTSAHFAPSFIFGRTRSPLPAGVTCFAGLLAVGLFIFRRDCIWLIIILKTPTPSVQSLL
jgi:hypothetical protein